MSQESSDSPIHQELSNEAIREKKSKVKKEVSSGKTGRGPIVQTSLKRSQELLKEYGSEKNTPLRDLAYISSILHVFNAFPENGGFLSIDSNQSLTKALLGDNALRQRFIPEDFKYLNQESEVIDRWGNPLIFQFNGAEIPRVHSAGKDGVRGSDDDLVF